MEREHFSGLVQAIFAKSNFGAGVLGDRWFFTNDGILAVAGDEIGKVGFGVACGLKVTQSLLESVDQLNRSMQYGHYWLSPGRDEENWSLICGFKFPYLNVTEDTVINICIALVQHNSALISAVRKGLDSEPHRQYWVDETEPPAQALVLISHLA